MLATKQSIGRFALRSQKSLGSLTPCSSASSQNSSSTPIQAPSPERLSYPVKVQHGSISTYAKLQCNLAREAEETNEWSGFNSKLWPEVERMILDSGRSQPWIQFLLVILLTLRIDNLVEKVTSLVEQCIYHFPYLEKIQIIQDIIVEPIDKEDNDVPSTYLTDEDKNKWRRSSGEFGSRELLSPATVKPVEAEDQSCDQWGHFAEFVEEHKEENVGFLGPAFQMEKLDTLEETEDESQEDALEW
mmetsp:Transcript_242/g.365  ORF Transcript_242/g.365 Transcript_242/m.365 type:complete len:245 (-) Transcript_242:114-848(-)